MRNNLKSLTLKQAKLKLSFKMTNFVKMYSEVRETLFVGLVIKLLRFLSKKYAYMGILGFPFFFSMG